MTGNVYAKLQHARVALQDMNLKKSGQNTFAGYDYFELGDFMPAINKLFSELNLFSQVSFTNELATLTILNAEKPEEQIIFTSPMADANLKGCHPIQNAGAVQTYQRRYLYTTALEIVEQDVLDKTTGKDAQTSQKTTQSQAQGTPHQPSTNHTQSNTTQSSGSTTLASEGQTKMLYAKHKATGWSDFAPIGAFLGYEVTKFAEVKAADVTKLAQHLDRNKAA